MTCKYFSPFQLLLDSPLIFHCILCLPFYKVFISQILTKSDNRCIKYKTIYDLYSPQ